jgi:hypothetical protein
MQRTGPFDLGFLFPELGLVEPFDLNAALGGTRFDGGEALMLDGIGGDDQLAALFKADGVLLAKRLCSLRAKATEPAFKLPGV